MGVFVELTKFPAFEVIRYFFALLQYFLVFIFEGNFWVCGKGMGILSFDCLFVMLLEGKGG